MAFAVLSLSQVAHTFNMRAAGTKGQMRRFSSSKLLPAAAACVVLQVAVISIPALAGIFRTVPLNGLQWLVTGALALFPLVIVELEKRIFHQIKTKKNKKEIPVNIEK